MATRGKICVSIFESDPVKALASAARAASVADLVELRLDAMADPDPSFFLAGLNSPVLFTCRPEWEGGAFKGSEEERQRILMAAIDGGAAFVDIELRAEQEMRQGLISAAKKYGVKTIVSWHDFKTTASGGTRPQNTGSTLCGSWRRGTDRYGVLCGASVPGGRSGQERSQGQGERNLPDARRD